MSNARSSGAEKRVAPRVSAKGVAAHLLMKEETVPCEVTDVSAGGLRVESPRRGSPGTEVSVSLARAGWSKALRVGAMVVHSRGDGPYTLGLAFEPLDPYARAELSQLMRELGGAMAGPYAPAPRSVPAPDAQKLALQMRGVLQELGEVRDALAKRDQEVEVLTIQLHAKDEELAQVRKAQLAAEQAVQRLATQLAARR